VARLRQTRRTPASPSAKQGVRDRWRAASAEGRHFVRSWVARGAALPRSASRGSRRAAAGCCRHWQPRARGGRGTASRAGESAGLRGPRHLPLCARSDGHWRMCPSESATCGVLPTVQPRTEPVGSEAGRAVCSLGLCDSVGLFQKSVDTVRTSKSRSVGYRGNGDGGPVETADGHSVGGRRGDDDDGSCARRGAPRGPGSPAHLERRRFNQRRHSARLAQAVGGPGRVSRAGQLLLRRDQLGYLEQQAGLALMRARRALLVCSLPARGRSRPDACAPRGRRVRARTLRIPRG